MSKRRLFMGLTLLQLSLLSLLFLQGQSQISERSNNELVAKRELVRALDLTDLSIWTEARYTRHPSQADLFTPFQNFPGALDHFPAGSILAPATVEWKEP